MADRVQEARRTLTELVDCGHDNGYSDAELKAALDALVAAVRAEERWQAEYRVGKAIHNTRKAVIAEAVRAVEGRYSVDVEYNGDISAAGTDGEFFHRADILAALTALQNKDTDTATSPNQPMTGEGAK